MSKNTTSTRQDLEQAKGAEKQAEARLERAKAARDITRDTFEESGKSEDLVAREHAAALAAKSERELVAARTSREALESKLEDEIQAAARAAKEQRYRELEPIASEHNTRSKIRTAAAEIHRLKEQIRAQVQISEAALTDAAAADSERAALAKELEIEHHAATEVHAGLLVLAVAQHDVDAQAVAAPGSRASIQGVAQSCSSWSAWWDRCQGILGISHTHLDMSQAAQAAAVLDGTYGDLLRRHYDSVRDRHVELKRLEAEAAEREFERRTKAKEDAAGEDAASRAATKAAWLRSLGQAGPQI